VRKKYSWNYNNLWYLRYLLPSIKNNIFYYRYSYFHIIVITTIKMIISTIIFLLYNYSQFHHRFFSQCSFEENYYRLMRHFSHHVWLSLAFMHRAFLSYFVLYREQISHFSQWYMLVWQYVSCRWRFYLFYCRIFYRRVWWKNGKKPMIRKAHFSIDFMFKVNFGELWT